MMWLTITAAHHRAILFAVMAPSFQLRTPVLFHTCRRGHDVMPLLFEVLKSPPLLHAAHQPELPRFPPSTLVQAIEKHAPSLLR